MRQKKLKKKQGKSDMQAMMSDTAGFQKVLEMSKREEEERQRKMKNLSDRDGQLVEQGIDKSKVY